MSGTFKEDVKVLCWDVTANTSDILPVLPATYPDPQRMTEWLFKILAVQEECGFELDQDSVGDYNYIPIFIEAGVPGLLVTAEEICASMAKYGTKTWWVVLKLVRSIAISALRTFVTYTDNEAFKRDVGWVAMVERVVPVSDDVLDDVYGDEDQYPYCETEEQARERKRVGKKEIMILQYRLFVDWIEGSSFDPSTSTNAHSQFLLHLDGLRNLGQFPAEPVKNIVDHHR
jgi:hypothetical protein